MINNEMIKLSVAQCFAISNPKQKEELKKNQKKPSITTVSAENKY